MIDKNDHIDQEGKMVKKTIIRWSNIHIDGTTFTYISEDRARLCAGCDTKHTAVKFVGVVEEEG